MSDKLYHRDDTLATKKSRVHMGVALLSKQDAGLRPFLCPFLDKGEDCNA
jgi:hypothetical protein